MEERVERSAAFRSLPAAVAAATVGRDGGADRLASLECLDGWLSDCEGCACDFGHADGDGLDLQRKKMS